MGYPSHLTDVARNGLKCNIHADEADRMVSEVILYNPTTYNLHFSCSDYLNNNVNTQGQDMT